MKTKISVLLIAFSLLFIGAQNKTADGTKIKKGMIKVAILYPNAEGKTFDMDYYATRHMPLAASLFGKDLKAMSIDKGLASGRPGESVPYLAIGYFYFDDMASFQRAMGTHSKQLGADVPNYTNVQPTIQVSEVIKVE